VRNHNRPGRNGRVRRDGTKWGATTLQRSTRLRNPTINFSPRTQKRGHKADLSNPFPGALLADAGRREALEYVAPASWTRRKGTREGKSCGQARRLVRSSPFPHPRVGPSRPILSSTLRADNTYYQQPTHHRHTVTHAHIHSFRSLFLRFPLSANPSHRPPGDLAGNQTRGSHGVHSRTKDSHPRRRSTTSSHAVGLLSSFLVSSHQNERFEATDYPLPVSKATASLTWQGWITVGFESGRGSMHGKRTLLNKSLSTCIFYLGTRWLLLLHNLLSYTWEKIYGRRAIARAPQGRSIVT